MKKLFVPPVLGLLTLLTILLGLSATSHAATATLRGTVQSGGNLFKFPLPGVSVTLYKAHLGQPSNLGAVTTDNAGKFLFPSVNPGGADGIYFLIADLGKSAQLVAILGESLPPSVTVNELTTVAASYSMAQFYRTGVISGDPFVLKLAAGMNDNLVNVVTGEPSEVLLLSPNADQTNSLRSTRALANLLAACTVNRSLGAYFRELAKPFEGSVPATTPEAMANLAREPWRNVFSIYLLTKMWTPYTPGLALMPDAWTLTVKVNNSGDDNFLFGGTANIAFDRRGYAWVTNNVVQGQTVSSTAVMVLKPNGKPSDGTNGTPLSPLTSGGILGVGFGVTIDPWENVWFGNFGWGNVNPSRGPNGNGSLSEFLPNGQPVSGSKGYQGGPVRVQGVASDAAGNIWSCSYGNDSVFVFLGGDPRHSLGYQLYSGSQPFSVAVADDQSVWIACGGGFDGKYPSSVSKYVLVQGTNGLEIQQQFLTFVGKALKGISVDSQGNAWVASQGDSRIYALRPDGTVIKGYFGGGIDGPWGATVDGDDNIWVANFGPLLPFSNFTHSRISKLAGVNSSTHPGRKQGDPLTPWTGCTVPSAGSQVRLHNGDPLYGKGGPPSYSPLMRLTNTVIDRAGNVWALNNWKPDFNTDVKSNPGGDGVVIFVGLATPPKRPIR